MRNGYLGTGFVVFMTGLPGSGKTTLARRLGNELHGLGRVVSLLDGDEIRTHLSSELGFSRAHRDLNVRRVGFVAGEVARHGGAAVCSLIAPHDASRKAVRDMIEPLGVFILVHLATPLEVCETRDLKGNYARARNGELLAFTGVSDPYESPEDAEIVLDMAQHSPEQGARVVLEVLLARGVVARAAAGVLPGRAGGG